LRGELCGWVPEQRPVEVVVERHLHGHPDPSGEVVVALEAVLLGLDEGGAEDEAFCLLYRLPEGCCQVPGLSHAVARESVPVGLGAALSAGAMSPDPSQ